MYKKLAKLMEEKHVNASDVSRGTGIAKSSLSAWKNGKCQPKLDKIIKLANYFGVSVAYFIDVA